MVASSPTCRAELGDHYVEDGDEEEGVGAEEEEDGPDVDPLQVGALHEGAAGLVHLFRHLPKHPFIYQ
jgi:hypothetical protein